ncbi:MAG: dimethylargininase [Gemmatimonadetes bacterium]|nr:dimethylargininase [Gemmatimonadota bacterium]
MALVRAISDSIADCELTHVQRDPIDITIARTQHAGYVDALRDAGCTVIELPAAHDLPDAVFVEDTAIVLDELAIVTLPGASSRRGETDAVAVELARHRPVIPMTGPAELDGGDVLRLGRTLFVGVGGRTNEEGVRWLGATTAPFGYRVVPVHARGCLHLKTAVTAVRSDLLLVNPGWVDCDTFGDVRHIETAPDEPFAANALFIGGRVIYPVAFPATLRRLTEAGVDVLPVDVSELAKAEGGVTCCSIIVDGEGLLPGAGSPDASGDVQ